MTAGSLAVSQLLGQWKSRLDVTVIREAPDLYRSSLGGRPITDVAAKATSTVCMHDMIRQDLTSACPTRMGTQLPNLSAPHTRM